MMDMIAYDHYYANIKFMLAIQPEPEISNLHTKTDWKCCLSRHNIL